ncbi:MAG: site-specific integrase [Bacteroidales bacterium]|nr:site-specific integrase [Bacteroidales bacterium]
MRSTFKVLFYVNGSKEKNGIVPIMGRVTINGSVAQFSCKQSIHKDLWDVKGNRAKGKSKESRDINLALDNIKAQIIKHYQRISDREAFVTAEMVRNAYQGIGTEYETLLRAFDKENEAFAKRVGKDRSLRTYQKYLTVRKYLAEFIKVHYKRNDIAMNELTEDFIRDYCLYLRNEVGLAQSSVWIYSIPLKHIVTTAHYNGKIARNPFAQYKVDPDHKELGFLTEEELQAFTTVELNNPDLELARDLFVFGCWTGISFIDIKNLTTENITMLGGSPWIVSKRQKTGVPFQIKLMDIPMQIIKRYEPYRISNNLFNIGSHDVINRRIKEVAKICGIEKRTSFHLSRHTFAVLALNYGMPIESVSKILGHTNITTTQIYAKVTNTKLEHDISMFESRVSGRFAI